MIGYKSGKQTNRQIQVPQHCTKNGPVQFTHSICSLRVSLVMSGIHSEQSRDTNSTVYLIFYRLPIDYFAVVSMPPSVLVWNSLTYSLTYLLQFVPVTLSVFRHSLLRLAGPILIQLSMTKEPIWQNIHWHWPKDVWNDIHMHMNKYMWYKPNSKKIGIFF